MRRLATLSRAKLRALATFLLAPAFYGSLPAQTLPTKPDPLAEHPEKGPFLFCYFLGNGDGLHLASSPDGLKFTPIGDKIYLKPTIGINNDGTTRDNHLMRDPCIRQGPDGVYRLVWTTGWYQRGFGVSSSPDLMHWSEPRYVEAMKHEPAAHNTWAPELFYDDMRRQWMIFWASTIPGKFSETLPPGGAGDRAAGVPLNHRIYYTTTKDFQAFSETKLLYDPGFNCIDATIARLPTGRYFMVIKDETAAPVAAKNLRTATADDPTGPWSEASDPISPPGMWVEGPSIAQVNDDWYVYYDKYTAPQKYGALKTRDFQKWEPVNDHFAFPPGARHGTIFPTTQIVIDRLRQSAG